RLLLGILKQEKGQIEPALAEYRAAAQLDEKLATARQNIGLCQFALGRVDEARDELLRAVEIDPSLAEAHYALGVLFMDYFDSLAEARDHLKEYQRLGGADSRVSGWLKSLGE